MNTSASRRNARVARNSSAIAVKFGSSDVPCNAIQTKFSLAVDLSLMHSNQRLSTG